MPEKITETARTFSDILREQGVAVVLCVILTGFLIWTNYQQSEREDANREAASKREASHLLYQQEQTKEMITVISANTTAMQSVKESSSATAKAVEALRMEIMKK